MLNIEEIFQENNRLIDKAEKKAQRIVYTHLSNIFKTVKTSATQRSIAQALFEVELIRVSDFKLIYQEIYQEVGFAMYQLEASRLEKYKKSSPVSFFSEIWRQYVLRALNTQEITERITRVTQTTKDLVRSLLIQAQTNRLAPREIARLFQQNELNFSNIRALRIARTETTYAAALGTEFAAQNSQLTLYKIWNHYKHGNYRDSHAAINKQYVPISGKFTLPDGIKMRIPGDPAGGAKEVINCRCNYTNLTMDALVELGYWKG